MKAIVLLIVTILITGCAFKGIDSCIDGDIGNGCQPIGNNLSMAVAKSEARQAGKLDIFTDPADDDYTDIDTALIRDEYRRTAGGNSNPTPIPANQVQIRIYPYSDGERYYDTRDIYILIQKPGWNKGAYVYNRSRTVSIAPEKPKSTPKIAYISLDQLNVRVGASNQLQIIGVVKKGQEIKILSERNGWYEVDIVRDDKTIRGWVLGKYTTETKPTVNNPHLGFGTPDARRGK